MKTKNEIAEEIYGLEYSDLTLGQKQAVGREYNNQEDDFDETEDVETVTAEIGRVGHNGTKKCIMEPGATIATLLSQSGYVLDERKEKLIEQSTGATVNLSDEAEDGEVYVIAPEVKSAN